VAKTPAPAKKDVRFLDEITVNNQLTATAPGNASEAQEPPLVTVVDARADDNASAESVSVLKTKYASLLGTLPELLENTELLKSIDYWYGTRYQMGGTSKSGIDCSAFVQAVYLSTFAMTIPRTAFEQYRVTDHISAVEMREGDLVFFNTTGGVSHVGIYLTNNKFVHASSSKGVTISDLFDPYYLKRFLGVGRIEKPMTGTR
jgi:lipoprotein Spr